MQQSKYTNTAEALHTYTEWYCGNQARVVDPTSCTQFLRLAMNGRLYILHLLLEDLMSLRQSHTDHSRTRKALDDFTQWYAVNEGTIVDAGPMLQFLKKAQDDSLHLLHLMYESLQETKANAEQNHRVVLVRP